MTVEIATLDTLVQAFQDHKSNLNQRMTQLENSAAQPALPQPTQCSPRKIEDNITMTKFASNRPAVSMNTNSVHHDFDHNNAFINYVRKGDTQGFEQKSLSSENENEGGYLVPHSINYELGKNLEKLSSLRQLASVTQISTGALDLLVDKEGAEVGWVSENENREKTNMSNLTKIIIPVHEMYARPSATQRLLDDSAVNLENWIAQTVAYKMAMLENKAFLTGDGHKKPKGILSYGSSEKYEWGKIQGIKSEAVGKVTVDDLINLQTLLKTEYLSGAAWIMSRQTASAIRRIKNRDEVFIWQSSMLEGQPDRLLGYPIHINDEMLEISNTATNSTVLFGNFKSGYQIVDRQGIYTLRDPYSAKPYVEFYTTKRVGGDVINFDAIKTLNVKHA